MKRIEQLFATDENRDDEQPFETEQSFAKATPRDSSRPSRNVEENRIEEKRLHDEDRADGDWLDDEDKDVDANSTLHLRRIVRR